MNHTVSHLANFDLFTGLSQTERGDVLTQLKRRSLQEGEYLCRLGEASDCLWLIESGLLEVRLPDNDIAIARLRRHEVVGETSLFTREARTSDVVAVLPTDVLELDQHTFEKLTGHHPQILRNVIRILLTRQARHNLRLMHHVRRNRGELVTLVVDGTCDGKIADTVGSAARALGDQLYACDLTGRFRDVSVLGRIRKPSLLLQDLDQILATHKTILAIADSHSAGLPELLLHSDKAVLLMEAASASRLRASVHCKINMELVPIDGPSGKKPPASLSVLRPVPKGGPLDPGWLARHLTRTKLGLALGAGGAKGYAHVAAIRTLREAGYKFDSVTGTSIGAIIGAGVALGLNDDELTEAAHHLLSYEVCGPYFRLNKEMSEQDGLNVFFDALTTFAGNWQIENLPVPFALMTADLNSREPFLFKQGKLSEALHAALSIPGLARPYPYEDRRLVDGVTITPVPTNATRELGADIVVAVNLMSRDELPAWPADEHGHTPPIRPPRQLDPVLETIIMLQTDVSVRHSLEADVVLTPQFGPSSWRDLEYETLFGQAGRRAAQAGLPQLQQLAKPL